MFEIITAEQAANIIKDNDCICLNAFLLQANPEALEIAIYERYCKEKHPSNLTIMGVSGFGGFDDKRFAEPLIGSGAVNKIIASHFNTMPVASNMIWNNKIEGYGIPLGVMSHTIRAKAGGHDSYISKVGLGIYVDPRIEGAGMNDISHDNYVDLLEINGSEYLSYHLPDIDVALFKATAVDPNGNISFNEEFVDADALSIAQATKASGGKVIVQVSKTSETRLHPRDVVIPGILVDYVVVVPQPELEDLDRTMTGDKYVPTEELTYWADQLITQKLRNTAEGDLSTDIIGKRAAQELHSGDVVNIGAGLPEHVGNCAADMGINNLTLTVEAGGIGGLPAPGKAFGATIGADMLLPTPSQFDFYDGGGLDICFMGALEVDQYGNVNVHKRQGRYMGIGGFANITRATKNIVFCFTFRSHGLVAVRDELGVHIQQEGTITKVKKDIMSISFSAEQALYNGQKVLYVTERCVFELVEGGLRLKEVYPGIDLHKDILDQLDFDLVE